MFFVGIRSILYCMWPSLWLPTYEEMVPFAQDIIRFV
jgi:hypothetical protein